MITMARNFDPTFPEYDAGGLTTL